MTTATGTAPWQTPCAADCDLVTRWDEPPPPLEPLCPTIEEVVAWFSGLKPRGLVWPRGPESVQERALAGLSGGGFWPLITSICGLLDETDPRTVAALLDRWERWLGIPDECFPAGGAISERRRQIALVERLRGGQSRRYFVDLAALLGYRIEIEELTATSALGVGCSRIGVMRVGPREALAYTWVVHVRCYEPRQGRTGAVIGATPIGTAGVGLDCADRLLECLLARLKPAHTAVIVSYGTAPPDCPPDERSDIPPTPALPAVELVPAVPNPGC